MGLEDLIKAPHTTIGEKDFYMAPEPFMIAGTVFTNILKSNHNDQLSIYFMSSSIHLSKDVLLLPLTCQRHVMPGCTLNLRRCQSWLKPLKSLIGRGLGPTRLISPFKTLNICGISSILVFRRNLPNGVMRGSSWILNTGPSASFICSNSTCLLSAPGIIVLNL